MSKGIILVDCDDVLVDFLGEWIIELNHKYHTNYSTNDVTDWNLTGLFPEVSKEELLELLHVEDFWKRVEPIYDSILYLKMLISEGYEIYVVTATDYRNIKWKVENVIHKYYPFISDKNIITCYNKQLVNGDYLIDDYLPNLIDGNYKGILFTSCHNRDDDVSKYKNITRADSWKNVYDIIHKNEK